MSTQAVPKWYWVVSVLFLLWEMGGVFAFGSQVSMGPEQLATLPEAQRNAFSTMPTWAWAAYGVGTIGALAAAICLLLRRAWAVPLYAISLVAVVAQFGWTFLGLKILDTMPAAEAVPFPAFIIALAILALWFAMFARKRGWIA